MPAIGYEYNEGILQRTTNVIKKGIKYSAYGAFLALGTVAALHLYNNPGDRAEFTKGLGEIKKDVSFLVMAPINELAFKVSGHTMTEATVKTAHFIEEKAQPLVDKGVEKAKETKSDLTNKEKLEAFGHRLENAKNILIDGLKGEKPAIEETIKKDATDSSNDVKGKIRQIRQYSGDLTERLGQKIKP